MAADEEKPKVLIVGQNKEEVKEAIKNIAFACQVSMCSVETAINSICNSFNNCSEKLKAFELELIKMREKEVLENKLKKKEKNWKRKKYFGKAI